MLSDAQWVELEPLIGACRPKGKTPLLDPDASAAVEAQHALERTVTNAIRRALRPVAEQPATGRYAMPSRGPELDTALRGLDPLAVAVVFPAPAAEPICPML